MIDNSTKEILNATLRGAIIVLFLPFFLVGLLFTV